MKRRAAPGPRPAGPRASVPSHDVLRRLLDTAPPPRTSAQEDEAAFSGPRKRLAAELPGQLVDAFRAACQARGLSQRDALERLVRSYVERHGLPAR
ncbi:MAG: hypothetical protein AB7N76_00535 [Planctomycetota bacterium]